MDINNWIHWIHCCTFFNQLPELAFNPIIRKVILPCLFLYIKTRYCRKDCSILRRRLQLVEPRTLLDLTGHNLWLDSPKKEWLGTCLRLEPNDLCHVLSCYFLATMVGLSTWSVFQFARLANASSEWRTVLKTPQNQQNYVLMSRRKIKNFMTLTPPCQNNSVKRALLDRPDGRFILIQRPLGCPFCMLVILSLWIRLHSKNMILLQKKQSSKWAEDLAEVCTWVQCFAHCVKRTRDDGITVVVVRLRFESWRKNQLLAAKKDRY